MADSATAAVIVDGLRALGLEPGDDVLVHSSLSSLGQVEGGAETVCDALIETVGPAGTVCAPTITGSREYSKNNPPRFSPDDPCWTGAIPEALRARPGALRSLHPTHSVACIGPRAKELCLGHEFSLTPCGDESPYMRLARTHGKILFIGCGFESNTTLHGVEEEFGLGYVCQSPLVTATIAAGGEERTVRIQIHAHGCGPGRNFERALPLVEEAGGITRGKVAEADCILVNTGIMVKVVMDRLAEDPDFLLPDSDRGQGWADARINPEG